MDRGRGRGWEWQRQGPGDDVWPFWAGGDNVIIIWNVGTGEVLLSLDDMHPDVSLFLSFKYQTDYLLTLI